ncbi:hypothetical protein ABPG74_019824 [Tetrahymena malaccensis]
MTQENREQYPQQILQKDVQIWSILSLIFGDEGISELSSCFSKCSFLQNVKLLLSNNKLSVKGLLSLAQKLSYGTSLITMKLCIVDVTVTDEIALALGTALQSCANLQDFSLTIDVTNQIASALGLAISNCKKLKNFKLIVSQISSISVYGIKNFVSKLSRCSSLSSLSIKFKSNIIINESPFEKSQVGFTNFTNLKSLSLVAKDTEIIKEDLSSLISDIHLCPTLETLQLKFNYTNLESDEGANTIATTLAKCTNLKALEIKLNQQFMKYNQIGPKDLQNFSQSLSKCSQLSSLNINLNENNIQDEGAQAIVSVLPNLVNLYDLYVSLKSCGISSVGISCLNPSLARCSKLSSLAFELYYNIDMDLLVKNRTKYLKLKRLVFLSKFL